MKCKCTIVLLLCSIILVLSFSACAKEVSSLDDELDDSQLTIYVSEYDWHLKKNIRKYNGIGEKAKIKIIEIQPDEIDDTYRRMANEISSGRGPDLICINQRTEQYMDICKMAKQGAFADLDVLIENCKSFNKDKLNGTVIDAGIINGARVIMPLSYSVDLLLSSKQSFIANGIEVPQCMTIDTYIKLADEYYNNNQSMPISNNGILQYYIIDLFANNELINKTDKLKRVLEYALKEGKCWKEFDSEITSPDALNNFYFDNNILFRDLNSWGSQFKGVYDSYNLFYDNECKDIIFFHPPKKEDEVSSYVASSIAININSDKKDKAFKFIEFLLLDQVQSETRYNYNLPVSKMAFELEKINFKTSNYKFYDETDRVPIPENIAESYIEFIENVDTCEFRGNKQYIFYNLIVRELDDYVLEKIDFDTLIDNINDKLTLYYSE